MKNLLYLLGITLLFWTCQQNSSSPWTDFVACGSNACVDEALAVQEAFVKDPKTVLAAFQETYAKGEDHVIGWLYTLRDSVLFNPKFGSIEERMKLQKAIVDAANPFVDDPKLGEMAKSVVDEIGMLAIASEGEDGPLEPSSEPITGTYAYDNGESGGNGTLKVSLIAYDKIRFSLAIVGKGPAFNQGMLEGEASLSPENVAVYSAKADGGECSLQLSWTSEGVSIKTLKGDPASCGFGNGVVADGDYKREGFDDPFLSKADAANAAKLIGVWQSTDDPKSSIKIGQGQYQDMYDSSEPIATMRYIYYPNCPADCNPIAKGACLKLIAQDDMCYTIVKADGKVLELSLIGGTGNTNRYVKK